MILLNVTELNSQIKSYLESTFVNVFVSGEASRVTYHSSGHLYFTLKDSTSSISCIMFKGNNQRLKFRVEEGMNITIQGSISLYVPRGSYQINCVSLEPSGEGSLAVAYEQLKKKLQEKNYFDNFYKKDIPKSINNLAIVTSNSTAALQDILEVARKRWPLVKISLFHSLVQGVGAKEQIVTALQKADNGEFDAILLTRGGGSKEDLWCFNEEIVADAIFALNTPCISAIGHEIDTVLSDLVADLRAPTPSAAIEMILPDINEIRQYIDMQIDKFKDLFSNIIFTKEQSIKHLFVLFERNSIPNKIEYYQDTIKQLKQNYDIYYTNIINTKSNEVKNMLDFFSKDYNSLLVQKEQKVQNMLANFEANHPTKKEKDGFAQILKDNKPINIEKLKKDDEIALVNTKVSLIAKIQ